MFLRTSQCCKSAKTYQLHYCTNSDGSSGTLKANNLVISDNVKVNTGFSAGTADTTVVIDDVFKGENISGAENITSSSVVWNAKGSTDASGNVDVTMSKNAYTDVATDASVNDGRESTGCGLHQQRAVYQPERRHDCRTEQPLKQVSGSRRPRYSAKRVCSANRFSMLADADRKWVTVWRSTWWRKAIRARSWEQYRVRHAGTA
ncbi:putative autotransported outer membrane protein involved in cell adhesion [Escherichia coli]|uniref:Putative autotransported outer membrane protein involved in cell adhesion n=1 Tax=Escherichia coli TaxID=562 RepID=A0A376MWS0_ECOLX|nr:putative autotransported outer membrane protein involved in cell adhesion [Escherichia coli]